MADIVYDLDGDDGKGTLFKDRKFFFLIRVPLRERWMSLVKANGGEIVKLEKLADFVIADHAKKDAPAESVSWKFIQDSVKDGRLQDITQYKNSLARPAQGSPHSSAVPGSQRQRRTPFTAEDDRILAEWVTEAERKGNTTKGNVLYEELERLNSRHTAQSWRDRWIKYVSCRPRPSLGAQTHGTPANNLPSTQASPPNERSRPHPSALIEQESSSRASTTPNKRLPTEMARLSSAPASSSKPTSFDDSSARLVTQNESLQHESSTEELKFTEEEIDLLIEAGADIMNLDENRAIDAWIRWATEYPNHTAQEWRNCFIELVAPRLQKEPKKILQRTSSRNGAKKDSALAPQDGKASFPRGTGSNLPISDPESVEYARPSMMTEEVFKKKLAVLAKVQGKEVVFTATIYGRMIPLYKIWQVIQSDQLGGFDSINEKRLWPTVARKLNFNEFQHKNAARELEICYKDTLLILDDAHKAFERLSDEQMAQIQLASGTAGENPGLTEDSHAIEPGRESLEAQSPRKRRRIDRDRGVEREIPGTPEYIGRHTPVHRSSHGAHQSQDVPGIIAEGVEEYSEAELFVRPFRRISLSSTSAPSVAIRPTAEPETQDFHFPLEAHDEFEPEPSVSASRLKKPHNKAHESIIHKKGKESTSTKPDSEAQTEAERATDLNAFIEHYISLGYDPQHVVGALEATTMDTGDAGIVMESLQAGNGVPRDIQGVWTSSDDEAVEEEDHPNFGAAVEKHGITKVGLRRRFLADQRAARDKLSRS